MAAIGDRIAGWVENVSGKWQDRLRGWALRTMGEGLVKGLEDMEPGAIDGYRVSLSQLRDNPNLPPGIRAFLDKALQTGNPVSTVGAMLIMVFQSLGILLGGSQPAANLFMYEQDKVLQTYRLDPQTVLTAWRRNPTLGSAFFEDLKEQGITDPRLEVLKLVTQFYPSAQDLVTWLAREVFEPDAISKYGLDAESDRIDFSLFAGAGVSREQALNYWRAHWQHTSFQQMVELLHRGLLVRSGETPAEPATAEEWAARDREGTEELYEWYRLVEIPPHWRDLLTASTWNVPTRVDVRRWYDMRVISEQELYSIYHRQGYHGADLEKYVLWTKVYTEFPSLMARWTNGWITEQDVRERLTQLGMPAERVEEMIQEKVKPEQPARVEEGKALTKTEIYKGVKAGVITREQGIELLMDLGYNMAEAEYLMDINVESLSGSPESFEDFKSLTQGYKRAVGRSSTPVPDQLREVGAEVVKLSEDVDALDNAIEEERANLIDVEPLPPEATARLKELQVSRNRAQAKLTAVQSKYRALMAEFRQQEG